MGSWGVTMRQSDYGLDLLGTIVDQKCFFHGSSLLEHSIKDKYSLY